MGGGPAESLPGDGQRDPWVHLDSNPRARHVAPDSAAGTSSPFLAHPIPTNYIRLIFMRIGGERSGRALCF